MKRLIFTFLLLLLAAIFCVSVSAAEKMTLTTYYPSPYGVYRQLVALDGISFDGTFGQADSTEIHPEGFNAANIVYNTPAAGKHIFREENNANSYVSIEGSNKLNMIHFIPSNLYYTNTFSVGGSVTPFYGYGYIGAFRTAGTPWNDATYGTGAFTLDAAALMAAIPDENGKPAGVFYYVKQDASGQRKWYKITSNPLGPTGLPNKPLYQEEVCPVQ